MHSSHPQVWVGWLLTKVFYGGYDCYRSAKVPFQLWCNGGNSEIDPYKSLATISSGTLIDGGRQATSYVAHLVFNPDLEWEKTNQFDFGFSFESSVLKTV